jgi:hypothetical protein
MKNVMTLALTLAISASAAFANDHLSQIASHARDLASDYRKMTVTLKNKNFPAADLRQELQDAEAEVSKLKALVDEYGATSPNLNDIQQKDWKQVQNLVKLLEVFQDRKSELLAGDNPHKQRNKIHAEAQALVTRATLLEQAALRLAGGTPRS